MVLLRKLSADFFVYWTMLNHVYLLKRAYFHFHPLTTSTLSLLLHIWKQLCMMTQSCCATQCLVTGH